MNQQNLSHRLFVSCYSWQLKAQTLTLILSLRRSVKEGLPFFWLLGFKGVVQFAWSVWSASVSFFLFSTSALDGAGKTNSVFFLRRVLQYIVSKQYINIHIILARLSRERKYLDVIVSQSESSSVGVTAIFVCWKEQRIFINNRSHQQSVEISTRRYSQIPQELSIRQSRELGWR